MRVQTINRESELWADYVNSQQAATGYHQYNWKTVIEKSFRHSCIYLAAIDNTNKVCGILPLVHMQSKIFGNFLVSLPFVNYGGLLCNTSEANEALISEAKSLRRSLSASHVELRHINKVLDGLPTKQHKVTMILRLCSDNESQWKSFNAKLRNQIRKAEKSGLQPVFGHLNLLDEFYDVFARNMRDLGTPVYAKEFFRNVLTEFPDTAAIIAVRHTGQIIAAGIAICFRDTLEIPWASSIGDFRQLCPNNMLYWEAIKYAITNKLTKFDFGRSTPDEGTYNFKKQWGAEPEQLNWQYLLDEGASLPELNPSNPRYMMAIKVWQKLPVSFTKILGPHIVRSIP